MVRIDRIYTRGGDDGETSLANGSRVPKTDPRVAALGAVDELNAAIGVAIAELPSDGDELGDGLRRVQNDLFDLGADVAVPDDAAASPNRLRVRSEQTARLETWIDTVNERLEPLTSFVLPGGSRTAARLHLARAVCRRAEVALLNTSPEGSHAAARTYLNRLSDLLFVLARAANDDGRTDVLWTPGANQT